MASTLSDELFAIEAEQILLTHGATHAFDLILRTLTKPGDTVFVEDPVYSNLLSLIRHHGCHAVGIPRDEHGLDMDFLAAQARETQPKLMFVNTVLQNPLGTSLTQAQAHRLLGFAEQFDFWLVEDDIYRELTARGEASLAAMDGLRRVIRVGSFSKTLSPVLRVGSICASASLLPELVRVKMLAGLTTSEVNERAAYHAITARPYKRMVEKLVSQLAEGRERTTDLLALAGMAPIARPRGGMFVSAGWQQAPSQDCNGKLLADQALKSGILLAPGEFSNYGSRHRSGSASTSLIRTAHNCGTSCSPSGGNMASAKLRRVINRDRLEADIAAEAVRVFAESGYEGASVSTIADNVGLSKQNLMYYFPTKQALYQRVLDDVLDEWLARMANIAEPDGEPAEVLRAYIKAKLDFSREHPWGSRVYAMEVISGAPLYGEQIRARVVPLVRKDIEVFERWIAEGRIVPVNATHLLFAIWAMTQSYADFSRQMQLVLGTGQLTGADFVNAEETITRLVIASLLPAKP